MLARRAKLTVVQTVYWSTLATMDCSSSPTMYHGILIDSLNINSSPLSLSGKLSFHAHFSFYFSMHTVNLPL